MTTFELHVGSGWPIALFAVGLLMACAGGARPEPASLLITDARVWTGDEAKPWAEAVACRGEKIVAVGNTESIAPLIGPETEVISVPGSMLVPGFIDSHLHFIEGGSVLASVQLRDADSPEEFARRIGEFANSIEPDEWITGGAWDHQNWGGELPARDWIDEVTPDNPVWVSRLDGHMAVANSLALRLAGVDAETPDVEGGEIVRGDGGRPTGLLKDNAMAYVENAVPPSNEAKLDREVQAAMRYVASHGVTSVHDMQDFESLEAFRRAHARGEMITRIYSVIPIDQWQRLREDVAENGRGDAWLRIGGLKGFMDGSLGSHTAAFFEPYTDEPDDLGLLVNELDDMRSWISSADAEGLHVIIHAIGDRAIRELLDIYRDVAEANGPRDRRFRIEHAQHIHPEDFQRFADQGVIAAVQPYHAIDDGRWAEKVIGPERAKTSFPYRSLMDAGAHVAFGSDWYVAPPTPLEGIYAAVTRQTLDGKHPDGWVPEQKVTVEQALHAYTHEAAYASFEEDIKGTLKPGMLADFVLIDRDLTAIPPEEIRDAKILRTIVGGKVVYAAE
jgi:predicted amidohydrolase YtcJ